MSYALIEGMAVEHEEHGTGEITEIEDGVAFVEFGRARTSDFIPLADLDVDWEFYRDNESVHE